MKREPTYEELSRRLTELEEILRALQNQEVDAIVGSRDVLMLRLKEAEENIRKQHQDMEALSNERGVLLEDLRIHQSELEEQAGELRQAQEEIRQARDKYVDLYDYAPVGYLTMSKNSSIIEANLTALSMLGLKRSQLNKTRLSALLSADFGDVLYLHIKRTLETNSRQQCEIGITTKVGDLYLNLTSTILNTEEERKQIRTTLTDTTERKKAEEELYKYREHLEELVAERTRELRELSHRLVDAQEKERAFIGSELHDEIGQYLTFTTILIDSAARKEDEQALVEAKSSVQEAISRIRNLSSMLCPRLIRSAGVLEALVSLIEEYRKNAGLKVHFDHTGDLDNIPEEVALATYRIVQESLTNVARHAKTSEVKIDISRERDTLYLKVEDNGVGFDVDNLRGYIGLTGMRERAVALGGKLNIASNHGQGTQITAEISLSGLEKA